MTKQFTPGSIVRVRGQLMGVGKASLLGLLDEAEDINDITQAERIAAQQGTTSADLVAGESAVDEAVALTPGQKAAATRAANKAAKEAEETAAVAEAEAKAAEEAAAAAAAAETDPAKDGDADPVEADAETGAVEAVEPVSDVTDADVEGASDGNA